MSFTSNTRDEVTLIRMKHEYHENLALLPYAALTFDGLKLQAANNTIRKTFAEVRDRNAKNLQAGSYDAVAEQCDEFFKSIAADLVER